MAGDVTLTSNKLIEEAAQARTVADLARLPRQLRRRHARLRCDWSIAASRPTCLHELGTTLAALGRRQHAREHCRAALAILDELGVSEADEVRARLAEADRHA
jgi:hypothetical protein